METVYNPKTKTYEIVEYDQALEACKTFIETHTPKIEVVDEESKKVVFSERTEISKKKTEIENFRKEATKAVTDSFVPKLKELEKLLQAGYDDLTKKLNAYEQTKIDSGEKLAKKYKKTLTIKSYDEETLKKIEEYAKKLLAKGKEIEIKFE